MSYFGELRSNWQPLAASTAGLSAGLSRSAYTNGVMGPHFLDAFGWSRSDFVLTGVISLLTFVFLPIYSTVLSLLSAAIGVSSALGAFVLSPTLQTSHTFDGFLMFAGAAALVGGSLFMAIGRLPVVVPPGDAVVQTPAPLDDGRS